MKKKQRRERQCKVCFVLMGILVLLILGGVVFSSTHFMKGTYIQGVDCSFMNVEKAKNKIEEELKKTVVTLKFANKKTYATQLKDFDIIVNDDSQLSKILKSQRITDIARQKYYQLEHFVFFNTDAIKEYLSCLPEMQKDSNCSPKNACIEWNDSQKAFQIVKEVYGDNIDFEKIYNFFLQNLEQGENDIDLFNVTQIEPKVVSSMLEGQLEEINTFLKTTISYKLNDGTTYILDSDIMKDWVCNVDEGKYYIDIANNVPAFVGQLNKKAIEASYQFEFNATKIGKLILSVQPSTGACINEEEEVLRINESLKNAQNYEYTPIYDSKPLYSDLSTYIELDITRQNIWMYIDNECILDTPCVTGNVAGGHNTPTGIYYLYYKEQNTVLRGSNNDGTKYASKVSYWMPFNGGIGFHDASWRKGVFGGEIYKTDGSHGCVNMPLESAETLYSNITSDIPIIIYQS